MLNISYLVNVSSLKLLNGIDKKFRSKYEKEQKKLTFKKDLLLSSTMIITGKGEVGVKRKREELKKKIQLFVNNNKIFFYLIITAIVFIIVLSFFIEIGYIVAFLAISAFFFFAKKNTEESDKDILKIEYNKERIKKEKEKIELKKEIVFLQKKIKEDPLDFDSNRKLKELESKLEHLEKNI